MYDCTLRPEHSLESKPRCDLLGLVEAFVAPAEFLKCDVAEARGKF
jgi:hypothetical protein